MTHKEIESDFKDLLAETKGYINKEEIRKINKAWNFAKLAHSGQKRKNGEPFMVHSLKTARKLVEWRLDADSIAAGILHDTAEHGAASMKDLQEEFGEAVARLVDGVTNVSFLKLQENKNEWYVENLRKMFLAMAKDLRVVVIKLAARIHNMRTLEGLPREKQLHAAKETLEIYAPLADRLGMTEVSTELQDLCFQSLYPSEYKKVLKETFDVYRRADKLIKRMKRDVLSKLAREGIKAKIQSRKKGLYSLWQKLQRPDIGGNYGLVLDIVAMRILVDTEAQCYVALGIVHGLYKPIPNVGVTDFIAQPKPNGYRSIHTKVIGPGNRFVEIQIRTHQMHQEAEYGVAAHWYLSGLKNKGKLSSKDIEEGKVGADPKKLAWVKQLAEWQKDIKDSDEFLEAVKFDALKERIFVFSPKGDVYDLPLGATPIDFAFAVHTNLGKYLKSAKVNGNIVSLDYKLKNGDTVEIDKLKNEKPYSRDWLRIAVTNTAKREITKSLRKQST